MEEGIEVMCGGVGWIVMCKVVESITGMVFQFPLRVGGQMVQ